MGRVFVCGKEMLTQGGRNTLMGTGAREANLVGSLLRQIRGD